MSKLGWIVAVGLAYVLFNQTLVAHSDEQNAHYIVRELNMPVGDLTALLIDVGAGDLILVGGDNQHIEIEAKIFGDQLRPDDYRLSLDQQNGRAVIYAHITSDSTEHARIDLIVSVPASMALEVRDGSGDIKISGMTQGLKINDRSGDIRLTSISGTTSIDDRSGDILVDGLTGPIQINDRSGEIWVKHIEGNVSIVDRSGDIYVKHLTGDLTIEDASGDITVKQVSGVVSVDDSSGSIDVKGAGDFNLLDDGSGEVRVENIGK